jgi:hypothetical protein
LISTVFIFVRDISDYHEINDISNVSDINDVFDVHDVRQVSDDGDVDITNIFEKPYFHESGTCNTSTYKYFDHKM